jgi:transglutaminase-like putative cysteine protease
VKLLITRLPGSLLFSTIWTAGVCCGLTCGVAEAQDPGNDIVQIVKSVAGHKGTTLERAQRLSHWLNANFEWAYTDYQKRTVQEIIAQRGGNCAEQARVLEALLDAAGIETRWVAEINIHTKSERRRTDAAQLIIENGFGFSVFGYMHNDHRWLEVLDDSTGLWIPSDPTLGVFGLDRWIEDRMGFGTRPEVAKDLVVPFVIVIREDRKLVEDRTEHYLIEAFNVHHDGRLSNLPAWPAWLDGVRTLSEAGRNAFAGRVNLHEYTPIMLQLEETYNRLKDEFLASHGEK